MRSHVGIKIWWRNHTSYPEETRLAMISVLGTDFLWEKHKNKVPHLLNRNFGDISEKAFSLGQSQKKILQLLDRHIADVTSASHEIGNVISTLHEIGNVTSTLHEISDVTLTLHKIADVSEIDCRCGLPAKKKGGTPTAVPMWLNPPHPPHQCNDAAHVHCRPTYDGQCWHANRLLQ
jgi:hypothetical protein